MKQSHLFCTVIANSSFTNEAISHYEVATSIEALFLNDKIASEAAQPRKDVIIQNATSLRIRSSRMKQSPLFCTVISNSFFTNEAISHYEVATSIEALFSNDKIASEATQPRKDVIIQNAPSLRIRSSRMKQSHLFCTVIANSFFTNEAISHYEVATSIETLFSKDMIASEAAQPRNGLSYSQWQEDRTKDD